MADLATIFQTVQIGVESTAGTPVAANKKLTALSIEPGPTVETLPFRAMGNKFGSLVIPTKEWTTAALSGVLTYTEIVYPLSSLISYAAPAQQGGTAAYLWTFAPDTDGADTVKTFTVEQGDATRAHEFSYGFVNALTINFSRNGIELDGEMIGDALDDGITMTGSPTEISLKPVLPTDVDVYLADTYAGLAGASALTRALSVSWSMGNRFTPIWPLASANGTDFPAVVEVEPTLEVKLKMEADAAGMALLTTLRAGDSKFIRIKATDADLIDTGYYYDIQIDTACKISDVSEFSDEDGVFAIEWTLMGIHDATWGQACEVLVQNELTGL